MPSLHGARGVGDAEREGDGSGFARGDRKEPLGPHWDARPRPGTGPARAARPRAAAGGFRGLQGNACQMDAGGRSELAGRPGLRGLVAPLTACPWEFLLHL